MSVADFVPYCGSQPVPGSLVWNFEPILMIALSAVGLLYLAGSNKGDFDQRTRLLFWSGWLVVAAALISPLCNLSVALFSARVTQHMILTLVAAPLVVLGRFDLAMAALIRPSLQRTPIMRSTHIWPLTVGGAAFAVVLWTWHLPGPYDATLMVNAVYWIMHTTTFGAALLLWHGLLHNGQSRVGTAMIVGFGTAVQMSLLGALLTMAPHPLFAVHSATTSPWGLSALEDQQLGGLIMWVPAGLLFTVYALTALAVWLGRFDTSHRQPAA